MSTQRRQTDRDITSTTTNRTGGRESDGAAPAADVASRAESRPQAREHPLVAASRQHGNQAMQALVRHGTVQPKLRVGQEGGAAEREADRAAARAVDGRSVPEIRQLNPAPIQRKAAEPLIEEEEKEKVVEARAETLATDEKLREEAAAAQIDAQEEEKEEEFVQTKAVPGQDPGAAVGASTATTATTATPTSTVLPSGSPGEPLPAAPRRRLEGRFGRQFDGVRVHTDASADSAARSLGAEAFTHGQDIYFRSGRFQPDSQEGAQLLAHELTHTVQQRPAQSPRLQAAQRPRLTSPDEPLEHEAETVARRVASGEDVRGLGLSAATTPVIARQVAAGEPGAGAGAAGPTSASTSASAATPAAPTAGGATPAVDLQGTAPFAPPEPVAERLAESPRRKEAVPVTFGDLASGEIEVQRRRSGEYRTRGQKLYPLTLTHPFFQPLSGTDVEPVLAVRIVDNTVTGLVTIGRGKGVVRKKKAIFRTIASHTDALGWYGMDQFRFPGEVTNEISDGTLRLGVSEFPFRLGGYLEGTGSVGVVNEAVTFDATATVAVPKLQPVGLELERAETGALSGRVAVPVEIANFRGNLDAVYTNGVVDIEGTVGYETEKMAGEVTLLVTDAETASRVAEDQLGPDALVQTAQQTAGGAGGEGGTVQPVEGPRALAGYGTITVTMTEWLAGTAQVVIDDEGHVTIVGEIAPPAEVILFEQRDYVHEFPRLEVRAIYGIPVVGNVFVFANVGVDALAKLGPAKLYQLVFQGTYSTDPNVFQNFSIAGTLNVSAFAGIRVRAEGGAGVEVADHDIKAGAGVNGLAGVRGYAEATPTLGYREQAAPEEGKQGEFYLKGHMEIAGQPFLGLGGDLFVELDSPWWSPAPDKTWNWPIGSLEYPLPGEFGIGADIDYVIGSGELPDIEFGEMDFDSSKFMTDLMNDKVPKGNKGEQETKGTFEDQTGGPPSTPEVGSGEGAGGQGAVADPPTLAGGGGGAPTGREQATPRREPGMPEVPAPNRAKATREGMKALGDLAKRSKTNPLTREQLDVELARLRREYRFKRLTPRLERGDWAVYAAMSEDKRVPVEAADEEAEKVGEAGQPEAVEADPSKLALRGEQALLDLKTASERQPLGAQALLDKVNRIGTEFKLTIERTKFDDGTCHISYRVATKSKLAVIPFDAPAGVQTSLATVYDLLDARLRKMDDSEKGYTEGQIREALKQVKNTLQNAGDRSSTLGLEVGEPTPDGALPVLMRTAGSAKTQVKYAVPKEERAQIQTQRTTTMVTSLKYGGVQEKPEPGPVLPVTHQEESGGQVLQSGAIHTWNTAENPHWADVKTHAEQQLISFIRHQRSSYRNPIEKITIHLNWSPCQECTKTLVSLIEDLKDEGLQHAEINFSRIYRSSPKATRDTSTRAKDLGALRSAGWTVNGPPVAEAMPGQEGKSKPRYKLPPLTRGGAR